MDDRYYEDDEFTPREYLDNNERGDGAVDETWVEEHDIEYPTPKKGIQCSYCNAVFSNYPDLFTHSKIHQEQKQLKFIYENQPCPGRLVASKFKNISLRQLEKQGKIIFSEKDNGWIVKGYEIETKNKIISPPQGKGTVIVFPSFMEHQVSPVTTGVRYSLVVWITGPPFI